MEQWFKLWFNSPYYHQLYFNRNHEEAAAFIDLLLKHLQPNPGAKMLDVACGKGRHALQLAQNGFDVTGIDLSEDSILEAKQHENDQLHFYIHDMRLPFRIHYYDYVFNFFTSFGYFRTQRENDAAIRTMAQSLKSNGKLIIDFLNVHYAEDHTQHRSEQQIGDTTYLITKWYDETHFYKKIEVINEELKEPLIYTEKVQKLTLGDFTEMLAFQKLQIKEVFGDYQLNRYDIKNSPRLIIIAEKTI
jgi:SAM-dependent methyltransferase